MTQIQDCLESFEGLNINLVIGDRGCRDDTIAYCIGKNAKIIRVYDNDFSEMRNNLIKASDTPWQMYLEPWETLISGKDKLIYWLENGGPPVIRCQILRGDIITKEVRIWQRSSNIRFSNPVFEYLPNEGAVHGDTWLYSPAPPKDHCIREILTTWRKTQPAAAKPMYYEACLALLENNYDEFVHMATRYLFAEKDTSCMSAVLTSYYLGLVQCYVLKLPNAALSHAMSCLGNRPMMSEFWCLVGDVFFQCRDYTRARHFYENAFIIGQRRRQDDSWPIHISKYDTYPTEMIGRCDEIKSKLSVYVGI